MLSTSKLNEWCKLLKDGTWEEQLAFLVEIKETAALGELCAYAQQHYDDKLPDNWEKIVSEKCKAWPKNLKVE